MEKVNLVKTSKIQRWFQNTCIFFYQQYFFYSSIGLPYTCFYRDDEIQAGTYGLWGALLAGGEVIYPTGYGTRLTVVRNFQEPHKIGDWRGSPVFVVSTILLVVVVPRTTGDLHISVPFSQFQEESTIGRANMSNWTPLDISGFAFHDR